MQFSCLINEVLQETRINKTGNDRRAKNFWHISVSIATNGGPGSSVGIATDYGLEGPGSNPGGDEIFRTRPDGPWGPPSLL